LYLAIPKYSRWDENLQTNSKEPYSLEFAEKLLVSTNKEDFKRILPADNLVKELEEYNYDNKATYVFLGGNYYLTAKECLALIDFVKRGNTAFISSRRWPNGLNLDSLTENSFAQLFDPIKPERMAMDLPDGLNAELYGFTKKYVFKKYSPYQRDSMDEYWYTLPSLIASDYEEIDKYEIIGKHELGNNFVKVDCGSGSFYLHSNPILFSNYFLVKGNGYNYLNDVLSFVPNNGTLLYDDNSRYFKYEDVKLNRKKNFYPLEIIMNNKALYAFVLVLIGLFITYVLFNAKRKQRTIPLLPDNNNTSIEFSKTIGALYLQSGNNKKLVEKKMKIFKFFILNKYGISTAVITEQNIKIIAQRTGLTYGFIHGIYKEYDLLINNSSVSAEELMNLHNSFEIFYNNTKR
jgi:hypothetical protein